MYSTMYLFPHFPQPGEAGGSDPAPPGQLHPVISPSQTPDVMKDMVMPTDMTANEEVSTCKCV